MATYRNIHSKIWTSENIAEISPLARLLFIYLFTNDHRNEACIYEISRRCICLETNIELSQLDSLFDELSKIGIAFYDKKESIAMVLNAVNYSTYLNGKTSTSIVNTVNLCPSDAAKYTYILKHKSSKWYINHLQTAKTKNEFDSVPTELLQSINSVPTEFQHCSNSLYSYSFSFIYSSYKKKFENFNNLSQIESSLGEALSLNGKPQRRTTNGRSKE